MKNRFSMCCPCRNVSSCDECTDAGCAWSTLSTDQGTFYYHDGGSGNTHKSYIEGEITIANGERASFAARIKQASGGDPVQLMFAGIERENDKIYVYAGYYEAINPEERILAGCVPAGDATILVEAVFGDDGVTVSLPLFGTMIHGSEWATTIGDRKYWTGYIAETGTPTFANVYVRTWSSANDDDCNLAPTAAPSDIDCGFIPGSVPAYVDVTLPNFETVGGTCTKPCERLSGLTLRMTPYTGGGNCRWRILVSHFCHPTAVLPIELYATEGSRLLFTIGPGPFPGFGTLTWDSRPDHSFYYDDSFGNSGFDVGCAINNADWVVIVATYQYLTTFTQCFPQGFVTSTDTPPIMSCPVRSII